jgi:hypothetical protein
MKDGGNKLTGVVGMGLCAVLYWAFVSRSGRPGLSARDIVNAADIAAGDAAPGEIIFLFPTNTGPPTFVGSQQENGASMPSVLGDTVVLFDGVPAPLLLRGTPVMLPDAFVGTACGAMNHFDRCEPRVRGIVRRRRRGRHH